MITTQQHRFSLAAAMITLLAAPCVGAWAQEGGLDVIDSSVLIRPWDGPFGGVPPWKSIQTDDFVAAFDRAIEMSSADIDKIADNPAPPTFQNTIVALEQAGNALTRVSSIFGVYSSNWNGWFAGVARLVLILLLRPMLAVTRKVLRGC